jgi:hypothetical protein
LTHPFKLKELAKLCAGSGEVMVFPTPIKLSFQLLERLLKRSMGVLLTLGADCSPFALKSAHHSRSLPPGSPIESRLPREVVAGVMNQDLLNGCPVAKNVSVTF